VIRPVLPLGIKMGVKAPTIQGCVAGVMVSIVAFQAVDPGPIPELRTRFVK
jgi:hypothetical protein